MPHRRVQARLSRGGPLETGWKREAAKQQRWQALISGQEPRQRPPNRLSLNGSARGLNWLRWLSAAGPELVEPAIALFEDSFFCESH